MQYRTLHFLILEWASSFIFISTLGNLVMSKFRADPTWVRGLIRIGSFLRLESKFHCQRLGFSFPLIWEATVGGMGRLFDPKLCDAVIALLSYTTLFTARIARSEAYTMTLTPISLQAEDQLLKKCESICICMSFREHHHSKCHPSVSSDISIYHCSAARIFFSRRRQFRSSRNLGDSEEPQNSRKYFFSTAACWRE